MDKPEIDKDGNGILFSGNAKVTECKEIHSNVFLLETELELERKTQVSPLPGQFYLVKSTRSNVQFGRPISVYHADRKSDTILRVQFLILQKGEGTAELCHLLKNDLVELSGPLGNSFKKTEGKLCICGGGIGVAPVANFASSLPPKSYDFYASFKSGSYGLEKVEPEKLIITDRKSVV